MKLFTTLCSATLLISALAVEPEPEPLNALEAPADTKKIDVESGKGKSGRHYVGSKKYLAKRNLKLVRKQSRQKFHNVPVSPLSESESIININAAVERPREPDTLQLKKFDLYKNNILKNTESMINTWMQCNNQKDALSDAYNENVKTLATCKSLISEKNKRMQDAADQLKLKSAAVTTWTDRYNQCYANKTMLQTRYSNCKNQFDMQTTSNQVLEDQIENLKEENRNAKDQLLNKNSALAHQQKKSMIEQQRISSLEEQLRVVRDERFTKSEDLLSCEKAKEGIKNRLKIMEAEIDASQNDLQVMRTLISDKDDTIMKEQNENRQLRNQLENFHNMDIVKKDEFIEMQTKLDEATAFIESKSMLDEFEMDDIVETQDFQRLARHLRQNNIQAYGTNFPITIQLKNDTSQRSGGDRGGLTITGNGYMNTGIKIKSTLNRFRFRIITIYNSLSFGFESVSAPCCDNNWFLGFNEASVGFASDGYKYVRDRLNGVYGTYRSATNLRRVMQVGDIVEIVKRIDNNASDEGPRKNYMGGNINNSIGNNALYYYTLYVNDEFMGDWQTPTDMMPTLQIVGDDRVEMLSFGL